MLKDDLIYCYPMRGQQCTNKHICTTSLLPGPILVLVLFVIRWIHFLRALIMYKLLFNICSSSICTTKRYLKFLSFHTNVQLNICWSAMIWLQTFADLYPCILIYATFWVLHLSQFFPGTWKRIFCEDSSRSLKVSLTSFWGGFCINRLAVFLYAGPRTKNFVCMLWRSSKSIATMNS